LKAWIDANKALPNFNYKHGLPSEVKGELRTCLIAEQFFLCAYSGVEITEGSCHIEHLKPQCECEDGEDVDYFNLVACFPSDGGDDTHGFGATVKKNWWVPAEFVSPLQSGCERRFDYTWTGKMKPAADTDVPATRTIENLGLDSDNIVDHRRKAICGFFGFTKGGTEISLAEAQILHDKIDRPNRSGQLTPFCFMLKRLLVKYIAEKKKKQKPPRKKR
jgi:uncharacterized protein (TIGR02646 family)